MPTLTFGPVSNRHATTEVDEPVPFSVGNGRFIWWKLTLAEDGLCDFDTQLSEDTGQGTDTVLAVYPAGGGTLATLDVDNSWSDDDSGGSGTSLISGMPLLGGVTYYIQVGMFNGATDWCDVVLRVTVPGPTAGAAAGPATTTTTSAPAVPPPKIGIHFQR